MSKNSWQDAPCFVCDEGVVREAELLGRTFNFGDEDDLVFDESIMAPACDSCAELYLSRAVSRRLNRVLGRLRSERKQQLVAQFLDAIARELPRVSRAAWEEALGLSRGYLSRLLSGTRTPDTALALLLRRFAQRTFEELELLSSQRRLPFELARVVAERRRQAVSGATTPSIPAGLSPWMLSASLQAHEMRVATAPIALGKVSRITVDISTQPVAIYHNPTTGGTRGHGTGPTQVGDPHPTVLASAA